MVKASLKQVGQPVIDVQAQVVDTPVEGVKVDCVNTAAGGLENSLPGSPTETASPSAVVAVPRTGTAVARQSSYTPDEDGFDESDVRYDTLRIVAGSGKLASLFQAGALVVGPKPEECSHLCDFQPANTPEPKLVRFVPMGLKKVYKEVVSQEEMADGKFSRIARNLDEVSAFGGTTRWLDDNTPPTFKPSATCIMLIEKPTWGEFPQFQMELDGKLWLPAVYYASNSAYADFGQALHRASRTLLLMPVLDAEGKPTFTERGLPVKRKFYPKNVWTFRVVKAVKGKYTVSVPEIRIKEETGPQLREYAKSFTTNEAETSED